MIEFIELEPFETMGGAPFTTMTLVPVFMIMDGEKYFVSNLPIVGGNHSPEYHRRELEGYKEQLLQTGGRYFKFYGFYGDPEELLAATEERGHTFVRPDVLFYEESDEAYGVGFTGFRGNLNEVSAAFAYRIYDKAYAAKLRERIKILTAKNARKKDGKT